MQDAATDFVETSLQTLERALHEHGNDLRNVQLATISPTGAPGLRTIVLRGFERSPAVAEMHSDARAGKIRDIAHASHVAILAWSAAGQLQLRFEGTATLHNGDGLARTRWDALSPNARKPYGLRTPSAAPLEDPAAVAHLPPGEQSAQFTVIRVALAAADILRLGPEGKQTRALAKFHSSGMTAHWVSP